MIGLGPFDLYGADFLVLYGLLGVIAVIASFVIPPFLRPAGHGHGVRGRPRDADDLAVMAGGKDRFAEAVTVRLLAAGAAIVTVGAALQIRDRDSAATLAERRIMALPSPVSWRDVTGALKGPAEAAQQRLAQSGLLMDAATAWHMRLIQTLPLALLLAFGTIKWIVGSMRDRPVEYLSVLLVLTLIAALLRATVLDRRTGAGRAVLADARAEAARLRRAVPTDEAALAVALFGTSVLAGTYLSDFHRMRSASGGDGSSSGDSGSGSGCGGGGCGGCGS